MVPPTMLFVLISSIAVFVGVEFMRGEGHSPHADAAVGTPELVTTSHEITTYGSDTVGDISRLDHELEGLRDKVDRLSRELKLVQSLGHLNRRDEGDSSPKTREEVENEEAFTSSQFEFQDQQTEVESRFSSETIDSEWAPRMESQLASVPKRFSDFGMADTQMVFHECRATLCNAEFIHGENEDQRIFPLVLAIPGIERVQVERGEPPDGGPAVSRVYFFREGVASLDASGQGRCFSDRSPTVGRDVRAYLSAQSN